MSDDELEDLSGDELGAALMRQQTERHRLREKIINDQVIEIREIRLSLEDANANAGSPQTSSRQAAIANMRMKHLMLLEECNNMWDIIPLSKALNFLFEKVPPHLVNNIGNEPPSGADEDRQAYEESIPFEVGSDEWCFVILILYKPCQSGHIYGDYDDKRDQSLLLMDQGPKDALIENGIVCGKCLKLSPKRRCSRCKHLNYCNRECQTAHWKEHKKQCREGRLKPSDEYDRSTRKSHAEQNGSAINFVRQHPYPKFENIQQFFTGSSRIPTFYDEDLHNEFEKLYKKVGTNTFKVYGRELGQRLFRDHGGMRALYATEGILSTVIINYPPYQTRNYDEKVMEQEQRMIAEALARRFLSSSWDGIGDWSS